MNNNFHYSLRNKEILRRVISKGLQSNNNPPQSQDGSSFDFDLDGLNLNNPDFAPLDTIPIPKSLETKPINPSIIETPLSDSILNTTNSKYNTKGLNSEDLGKLSTSISKDLDNSANAKNNSTLDKTVKTVGNAAGTALGVPGLGEVIGLINTTQDAVIEPVRKVFANKEASNLASGNLNKYRYNRVGRKFTESYQKYNTLGGIGMGIALGATVKEAIDPDLSDFYNYQDAKKKRNESLGILNNKGEMLANPMYSTAQKGGTMETGKPSYIPVSSQGLLQYPNQSVIVPTNNGNITMKYNNLPNKVLAINDENNQPLQVMEKGKDYRFRYNNGKPIRRILEVPIAQKGEEVVIKAKPEWKTEGEIKPPDYIEPFSTWKLRQWGKNDYTDYSSFNSAFRNSRNKGEEQFVWKGNRYTTDLISKKESDEYLESKKFLNEYYKNESYLEPIYDEEYDIDAQFKFAEKRVLGKDMNNFIDSISTIHSDKEQVDILNEANRKVLTYVNDNPFVIGVKKTNEIDNLNKPIYFSITENRLKTKEMKEGRVDGYVATSTEGNIDKNKKMYVTGSSENDNTLNTTYIHELSHKADENKRIAATVPILNSMNEEDYLSDPSEIEARKMSTLYYLNKKGKNYRDISEDDLEDLYKDDNLPYDIKQLLEVYSEDRGVLLEYLNNRFSNLKENEYLGRYHFNTSYGDNENTDNKSNVGSKESKKQSGGNLYKNPSKILKRI